MCGDHEKDIIIKYAHQHGGCVLHREYAVQAEREGQQELLRYLNADGCGV